MRSYVVFVGRDHWPEAFNALKKIGRVGTVPFEFLAVRTGKNADEIRDAVQAALPSVSVIVAEVTGVVSIKGTGEIVDAARVLEGKD